MIEAEFHAIWRDPAGRQVDISPKDDGEQRILFLPDPKQTYDYETDEGHWRESVREPLSSDPDVLEFVALARRRVERMEELGGWRAVGPIEEDPELVSGYRRMTELASVINRRHTRRNDPCYCGSGRKFKKCHGSGR